MKNVSFIKKDAHGHWVGDGFPVRNVFSYNDLFVSDLSPFLLLDYGGPTTFPPTQEKLGVGEHPHRGFETVTIVYDGQVEHRDSSGGGGTIGPGDVQWMTAGGGLVHEEFHGRDYARRGGPFEMVQLWVNLPAKDKMTRPRYQTLTDARIPRVTLADGAGIARVIAGELEGHQGPARTFSPMNLWDVRLGAGRRVTFPVADGHSCSLFVLKGEIRLESGEMAREAELAVMEHDGQGVSVESVSEAILLVMSGKPLDEPIVGYGPFVMNTQGEIRQAFLDYQSGKMGSLTPSHE